MIRPHLWSALEVRPGFGFPYDWPTAFHVPVRAPRSRRVLPC